MSTSSKKKRRIAASISAARKEKEAVEQAKKQEKTNPKRKADTSTVAPPPAASKPATPKWTGKTPTTLLHEYCQKNAKRAIFKEAPVIPPAVLARASQNPNPIPISTSSSSSSSSLSSSSSSSSVTPETTTQSPKLFMFRARVLERDPTSKAPPSVFCAFEASAVQEDAKQFAALAGLAEYLGHTRLHLSIAPEYRPLWHRLVEEKQQRDTAQAKQAQREERIQQRQIKQRRNDEQQAMIKRRQRQILLSPAAFQRVLRALAHLSPSLSSRASILRMQPFAERSQLAGELQRLSFSEGVIEAALSANPTQCDLLTHLRWISLHYAARPMDLPLSFRPDFQTFAIEYSPTSSSSDSSFSSSSSSTSSTLLSLSLSPSPPVDRPNSPTFSQPFKAFNQKPNSLYSKLICAGFSDGCLQEAAIHPTDASLDAAILCMQFVLETNLGDSPRLEDPDGDRQTLVEQELELLSVMFPDEFQSPCRFTCALPHLQQLIPSNLSNKNATTSEFVAEFFLPPLYPDMHPLLLVYPANLNLQLPLDVFLTLNRFVRTFTLGSPMIHEIFAALLEFEDYLVDIPNASSSPSSTLDSSNLSSPSPSSPSLSPSPSSSSIVSSISNNNTPKPTPASSRRRRPGPSSSSSSSSSKLQTNHDLDEKLQKFVVARKQRPDYAQIHAQKEELPVTRQFRNQPVTSLFRETDVLVLSGEPGSGKSTQIPQLIFEELAAQQMGSQVNIFITQPRRISATSLARRVATEMGTELGDLVGYSIRGESMKSAATRVHFVTTGYLLRLMSSGHLLLDQLCSHLIIDEVHERTQEIDLLLLLLKEKILPVRNRAASGYPPLKLVLMSATAEIDRFRRYFPGTALATVPGTLHPVEEHYLHAIYSLFPEKILPKHLSADNPPKTTKAAVDGKHFDVGLYVSLIKHLHQREASSVNAAILCFLPGIAQISKLQQAVEGEGCCNMRIFVLHSSLDMKEQQKVFQSSPRHRKVILATPIAETSITIPEIVYVIDSGRANSLLLDPSRNIVKLGEHAISQANARQRKGRAGRCQEGHVYRMYTHQEYQRFDANETPEIQRLPLHQLCLAVLSLQLNPEKLLARLIDPPSAQQITDSMAMLHTVGALAQREGRTVLSPLGAHLACMPTDIHIAKLLVFSSLLGCVEPMLTIAAYLSHKSPFKPVQRDDPNAAQYAAQRALFRCPSKSDLMTVVRLYDRWLAERGKSRRLGIEFCERLQLSVATLEEMTVTRRQLKSYLTAQGFEITNAQAGEHRVCNACFTAAFWPNIIHAKHPAPKFQPTAHGSVEVDPEAHEIKHFLKNGVRSFIHPQSFYFNERRFETNWLCYAQMMETKKVYVRDISMIWPMSIILFGGTSLLIKYEEQTVLIEDWIEFGLRPSTAFLLSELRVQLDAILAEKFASPQITLSNSYLIDTILALLKSDGLLPNERN